MYASKMEDYQIDLIRGNIAELQKTQTECPAMAETLQDDIDRLRESIGEMSIMEQLQRRDFFRK